MAGLPVVYQTTTAQVLTAIDGSDANASYVTINK